MNVKNGIIIDDILFEFTKVDNKDCKNCALYDKCYLDRRIYIGGICRIFYNIRVIERLNSIFINKGNINNNQIMNNNILGTHNSLTAYPLLKNKWCSWFINLFSKCQNKDITEQYNSNVRVFDLQITKYEGKFVGSHGLALYDVDIMCILCQLDHLSTKKDPIYVKLGLDNRFYEDYTTNVIHDFDILINNIKRNFKNINLISVYIEDINYFHKYSNIDEYESYWSLTWAKQKANKWYKFYYYLPIPILWKKLYHKEWKDKAKNHKYFTTDFV